MCLRRKNNSRWKFFLVHKCYLGSTFPLVELLLIKFTSKEKYFIMKKKRIYKPMNKKQVQKLVNLVRGAMKILSKQMVDMENAIGVDTWYQTKEGAVRALTYGFETQAGFYEAFVREFGYTPTEFLNMSKKKKPYRINLFKEEHIMVSHRKLKEILRNL